MTAPKPYWGIAAVTLGVIALGLAIIPGAVLGVPPPWQPQSAKHPEPERIVEGGTTIKFKGGSITFGGKEKVVFPPAPPPVPVVPKAVFVTTVVVALLGMVAAFLAGWCEKSYRLAGPAIGLSAAALVWQAILVAVVYVVTAILIYLVLRNLHAFV